MSEESQDNEQVIEVREKRVVEENEQTSAEWRRVLLENLNDSSLRELWKPYVINKDTNEVDYEPVFLPLPGSQVSFLSCPVFECLLAGSRGGGKAISVLAPVLTDSGWKQAGSVSYEDKLVAVDGSYTRIKGIFPQNQVAQNAVIFGDGEEIVCDDEHLWTVYDGKQQNWTVRTTAEIAEKTGKTQFYVPLIENPVPGENWTGYDPYIIGLVLGDGSMSGQYPTVYTPDQEIRNYLVQAGWRSYLYEYRSVWQLHLTKGTEVLSLLRGMKGDNKRVPEDLLKACPYARTAVLQGLMDTDGHCDKDGRCEFTSVSYQLAQDVRYLVRSLGGQAKVHQVRTHGSKQDGSREFEYRVKITHAGKFVPFRLTRKKNRVRKKQQGGRKRIQAVKRVNGEPCVCFEVEHESKLFVIQGFTVTHNTQILLMDYAKDVGKGYGNAWRGILFRRQIGDLDDVVQKIDEWFPKMFPGFRFNRSKGDYAAIFPDGEKLLLRHLSGIDDYSEYHGHQYPWQGYEELNEWEDLEAYCAMHSCCRPPAPGVPCRIRSTTNPYGPGHSGIKKRFGLPENFGKVIRGQYERDRVAIESSLAENFVMLHSDPEYPKNIISAARNPAQARAWLKGDWNVTSGGLVDDLWQDKYHLIPNFLLQHAPRSWEFYRSYDHGQSAPFSVGWWLVSDGTPMYMDDKVIGGVRGDIIRFAEWYGTDGDPNKGVRMASRDIAKGIIDREEDMGRYADPGPADNQIFDRHADRDRRGPADDMEGEGVFWERSDKSSGSRKRGYEVLRDYLRGAIPNADGSRDQPGIFVCARCEWFRELVVTAPRGKKDPDDVPESYADHCLSGDTLVDTARGQVAIRSLVGTTGQVNTDQDVYGFKNVRKTRTNEPVYRIKLKSGREVKATGDHLWMLEDGKWCQTIDLKGKKLYNIRISQIKRGWSCRFQRILYKLLKRLRFLRV